MRPSPARLTTLLVLAGATFLTVAATRRRLRKMRALSTAVAPSVLEHNIGASHPRPPAEPSPFQSKTTSEEHPTRPKSPKQQVIPFRKLLLLLAILLLAAVAGDLIFRGFRREVAAPVWETSQAETDPGRQAIVKYGCGGCHVIPGIRHATGRVGPQLAGFRDQMYIAGVLPNVPENLVAWIQNPQQFSPRTAMPNLRVTAAEAREIATYLYAHP